MLGGLTFLCGGRYVLRHRESDLGVRIGAADLPHVMTGPHVRLMDFTGRALKGFIYVSQGGYKSAPQLRRWIDRGLRFANSSEAPRRVGRANAPRRSR